MRSRKSNKIKPVYFLLIKENIKNMASEMVITEWNHQVV